MTPTHTTTMFQLKILPSLLSMLLLGASSGAFAAPDCQLGESRKFSAIAELCTFKDGMARIKMDHRWGFIDAAGKLVVAPQFDEAGDFSEGFASVKVDEKWGLIDRTGKWAVPATFDDINMVSDGLASASKGEKTGYIDTTGKFVVAPGYVIAGPFVAGVAMATDYQKPDVLIDKRGRVIKEFPENVSVTQYGTDAGIFMATLTPPHQLMHLRGRTLPVPEGAEHHQYTDGVFIARKDLGTQEKQMVRVGLKDLRGNWVAQPAFAEIRNFDGELAIASVRAGEFPEPERYGLINRKGKLVVPATFERINYTEAGFYEATTSGDKPSVHVFSAAGKLLFKADCDSLYEEAPLGMLVIMRGCDQTWLLHKEQGVVKVYPDGWEARRGENMLLMEKRGAEHDDAPGAYELYNGQGKRISASPAGWKKYDDGYGRIELLAPLPPGGDPRFELPLAVFAKPSGGVDLLTRDLRIVNLPDGQLTHRVSEFTNFADDDAIQGPLVIKGEESFGAVDAQGKWVVPAKYERLSAFRHGLATAVTEEGTVLIDITGKTYPLPEAVEDFRPVAPMMLEGDGEEGYMRYDVRTGKLTPAKRPHRVAERKRVGDLTLTQVEGKWGISGADGAWLVKPTLDYEPTPILRKEKLTGWITRISTDNDNRRELFGLLDARGRELLSPRFTALGVDGANGTLTATEDGEWSSVLNDSGKRLLGPVAGKLHQLSDGWFYAELKELNGTLNNRGEWLAKPSPVYFDTSVTHEGRPRRPYTLIDKVSGMQLMDFSGRISTRAAPLTLQQRELSDWWWPQPVKDKEGNLVETVFSSFDFKQRVRVPGTPRDRSFSDGVIAYDPVDEAQEGKIGLMDDTGRAIGMFDYSAIEPMNDGLAKVATALDADKQDPVTGTPIVKYGFIDRSGKLAVPAVFEDAAHFVDGRATVVIKSGLALIDKTGKLMLQGAWQCGRTPVLLDGQKNVVWPEEAKQVKSCKR